MPLLSDYGTVSKLKGYGHIIISTVVLILLEIRDSQNLAKLGLGAQLT